MSTTARHNSFKERRFKSVPGALLWMTGKQPLSDAPMAIAIQNGCYKTDLRSCRDMWETIIMAVRMLVVGIETFQEEKY